jgi:serine O-acetyltransferase
MIQFDIQRWIQIFGWPKMIEINALLNLLEKNREFRNLYYFRIFKGNFLGRVWLPILKIIDQECDYLILDTSCEIGKRLFIQHGLATIVMAHIGDYYWINQQVTIGHKDHTGHPTLGNHVCVTAGAKVIGKIKIGDAATIGANAVVLKDVPADCVVAGVPARIIKRKQQRVDEAL